MNDVIYHIAAKPDWQNATQHGAYTADSLASEGFIHCSTRDQVMDVARAIFRGRRDLLLLVIAASEVSAEIRYENLEGGTRLFPHIYGPLPVEAVKDVRPFDPDGQFPE